MFSVLPLAEGKMPSKNVVFISEAIREGRRRDARRRRHEGGVTQEASQAGGVTSRRRLAGGVTSEGILRKVVRAPKEERGHSEESSESTK